MNSIQLSTLNLTNFSEFDGYNQISLNFPMPGFNSLSASESNEITHRLYEESRELFKGSAFSFSGSGISSWVEGISILFKKGDSNSSPYPFGAFVWNESNRKWVLTDKLSSYSEFLIRRRSNQGGW